jgi:hypothetical protein
VSWFGARATDALSGFARGFVGLSVIKPSAATELERGNARKIARGMRSEGPAAAEVLAVHRES